MMEWEGAGWMMIAPHRGCALVVGYELVPSESGVLGTPPTARIPTAVKPLMRSGMLMGELNDDMVMVVVMVMMMVRLREILGCPV